MPKFCEINDCTGCGACFNICPYQAVSMVKNDKGFYNPHVNKEICTNCGLCDSVCPINNYQSMNTECPNSYAIINNDEKQRFKSASGGAFPLFATFVIRQGGTVFGVIWNKNFVAIHSKASTIDDLEKMYSSKYVQSDVKSTYKEAKQELQKGKLVLFTGTPCQIAGLKSYLKKDYENLLTIDIVCHGVPSPGVFEQYKSDIIKYDKQNILQINFRSKDKGWGYWKTLKINNKLIQYKKSTYYQLFGHNLCINDSCLNCHFNKLPRIADLTICDFWGVDDYDKSLNDKKGISALLLNNEKGKKYFNLVNKDCFFQKVPLEVVIKKNPNIVGSTKAHHRRDEFFEDIKKGESLKYCHKKYILDAPLHIKIYRHLPIFIKNFIRYKILKMEKV